MVNILKQTNTLVVTTDCEIEFLVMVDYGDTTQAMSIIEQTKEDYYSRIDELASNVFLEIMVSEKLNEAGIQHERLNYVEVR